MAFVVATLLLLPVSLTKFLLEQAGRQQYSSNSNTERNSKDPRILQQLDKYLFDGRMAVPVVEFSRQGYKIKKVFG